MLCYIFRSRSNPRRQNQNKEKTYFEQFLCHLQIYLKCVWGGGGGFDIYMFVRLQKLQPGALCFRLLVDQLKLHPRYWTGMWSAYLETSDKNPNFCWSCNQYIIILDALGLITEPGVMQYLFPKILRREMLVFQMNHISSTCSKASIGPHSIQI